MLPATNEVGDDVLLHKVLLDTGMPIDLAAQLPASALLEPLRAAGVRKVGHRQRILSRLHQRAEAEAAQDVARGESFPECDDAECIPRRLFTFWHDDPNAPRDRAGADAELVKCCLALMKLRNPSWEFRVLRPGCSDLPRPPVPMDGLTGAQLADWYRLCALAHYGGVYLDATCVTLGPLEAWVAMHSASVQGFAFVSDLETMESWAIVAPPASAFMRRWRDEFGRALTTGVKAYCASLPQSIISAGLRPSLTEGYLAIHAAWRVVRHEMPEASVQLASPVEAARPYRYLADMCWESPAAVARLFERSADELRTTPLIKLRGKERDSIRPLASYGRASGLACAMLRATVPTTVTERMAFVRCGLDPDASPS